MNGPSSIDVEVTPSRQVWVSEMSSNLIGSGKEMKYLTLTGIQFCNSEKVSSSSLNTKSREGNESRSHHSNYTSIPSTSSDRSSFHHLRTLSDCI